MSQREFPITGKAMPLRHPHHLQSSGSVSDMTVSFAELCVSICFCCYNRIPKTGQFRKRERIFFLTVLEARRSIGVLLASEESLLII